MRLGRGGLHGASRCRRCCPTTGRKKTRKKDWTPLSHTVVTLLFRVGFFLLVTASQLPATVAQEFSGSDRRLIASVPGDIMIGALFSVHLPPSPKQAQTRTCGEIREQYGIQRVEAAFQTIDDINKKDSLLPNITLGIEIRDSCWYSPTALEQSIEFIRDAIAPNEDAPSSVPGDNSTAASRARSENATLCPKSARRVKNLVGVIGPGSSTTTIQVQNLLQLFNIPQIGYSATSRDLSDKSFYKYFMRVVPSDFFQAQVMIDIVRKYNWTYISTVHTDGNYGGSGMEGFIKLAHEAGICIASSDSVLSNADDNAFDSVIRGLLKYPNAPVVACFCEGLTIRGLLKATRRLNVVGRFLFIGSDGWSDRHEVVQEFEEEALSGLSIRIYSTYVQKFDPYYFNLTVKNNLRNPWFKEFWQFKFNCSLGIGPKSLKYNRTCTGRETLAEKYKQDTKMAFVKKAIWTIAHGLHNMQRSLCPDGNGLCPTMVPVNGSIFLQYLMNVSFIWANETVAFDENGDPPGRYDIMNFQKINETTYEYVNVGSWISGQLNIFKDLQFRSGEIPESVCSKPCDKGMVKSVQSESVKCCWVCLQCKENEYLKDEYTCQACDLGWWPNDNLTGCYMLSVEYIAWTNTTAIVAMTVACLGFMVTVFVMVVFVRHNDTPVVKASTRELSYIIMVGMYLCYATTFALIAKPTQISCFLSRILPGLSFAMMYAALVTKTNRIARILAGSKKKIITKKPKFMSATAQMFITWLLISVEGGIISAMLVFEPADSMLSYPSLNRVKLVCNTTPLGVIAPLGFDFFLIAMCTVYAVKTRNVPENFNEAKFIGFTMYTTLVIWLAFIPTYFGSKSKVITMCLCVSFSALVALVLLFFPKVYIILFRPEKNSRSAFTTAKNVRCHIGYVNSGVSRNSSHSTSDFSMESPRNHSMEVANVLKQQQKEKDKSAQKRRPSFNIFERFRISKQDKIAASVAQHIRAVRAAEALDRKTKFKRTDSFHGGEAVVCRFPAQRSASSGDDSPGSQEKKKLIGILKGTYGSEAEEIPGFEELLRGARLVPKEETACQTTDDLLESWLPSLRRRVVRSETIVSTLTPDEDDEPPRYSGVLLKTNVTTHQMYDTGIGFVRPVIQQTIQDDGDRVEVEYTVAASSGSGNGAKNHRHSLSSLPDKNDVPRLKERAMGILPKRSTSPHYNRMQRVEGASPPSGDKTSASEDEPLTVVKRAELPSIRSEESLLDAASSIVEESASSGSEDTPGSGIYKHIIINLGSPGTSRPLSAQGFEPEVGATSSAIHLQPLKSPVVDNGEIWTTSASSQSGPRITMSGQAETSLRSDNRHLNG